MALSAVELRASMSPTVLSFRLNLAVGAAPVKAREKMIKEAIVKIVNKQDLSFDEAYAVMNEIMTGQTTATQNSTRLRQFVPEDVLFVAESGVSSASDVQALKKAGVNAILVGESLMRADNKTAHLNMHL